MSALLAVAVVVLSGYLILSADIPAWNSRGFAPLWNSWKRIFFTSGLTALGVAGLALALSGSEIISLAMGIMTYVLAFTGYTDFKLRLAPDNVTSFGGWVLLPIGLIAPAFMGQIQNGWPANTLGWLFTPGYVNEAGDILAINPVLEAYIQEGVWMFLVGLIFTLSMMKPNQFGWQDLKILVIVGLGLSWWIGAAAMIWLLISACLLQLLSFIPANIFGWGTIKSKKRSRLAKDCTALWNQIRKAFKLEPLPNPDRVDARAIAFIPALSVAFVVGPLAILAF